MSEFAINVRGLAKRYWIEHRPRHDTLRDRLSDSISKLRRRADRPRGPSREEFWALRELDFTVNRGEVIGIIGRNGAGKSTLLKILSRITEPTCGRIELAGRVASLLEVGTGFHPELSGRDNIFLNGAILGMARAEIRRKFDEIVAFADVERFLDTPVKHYSSGMYVRLAFAVAAHLEPEILIVDEVLAVGDMEFQKKCLGRLNAVSASGRTVIFVSHNLEALRAICQRGILLEKGRILAQGNIHEVTAQYQRPETQLGSEFPANPDRPSITAVRVDAARLAGGELQVEVDFRSPFPLRPPVAGLILGNADGRPIFGTNMRTHPAAASAPATAGTCILTVPVLPLHSGTYVLTAWLGDQGQDYDSKPEAVSFSFVSPHHYPTRPALDVIGPLDLECSWASSAGKR